jgi:hypothetical protein
MISAHFSPFLYNKDVDAKIFEEKLFVLTPRHVVKLIETREIFLMYLLHTRYIEI